MKKRSSTASADGGGAMTPDYRSDEEQQLLQQQIADSSDYENESSSPQQPPFLPLEELNQNESSDETDGGPGSSELLLSRTASSSSPPMSGNSGISSGGGGGGHLFPKRRQQSRSSSRRRRVGRGKSGGKTALASYSEYVPNIGIPKITTKNVVSFLMFGLLAIVLWDTMFRSPEDRWIKPEHSSLLLNWVQQHPLQGLVAIMLVIAFFVVVMVPLGTPLTLGCGYIYKGAYGWKAGIIIATTVSMAGSALGAVICFLLGRYLMRETVRKWVKKYPLFDAIDIASAEHGLRIMAMLYLTPILPLGPVSYMCGTTSMKLSSFVLAKVAATPLMMLYVFIGASTGSLISKGGGAVNTEAIKEIEENEYLIVSGIALSFIMIACITKHVKKELNTILERQQKLKPGEKEGDGTAAADADGATEEAAIEMGITRRRVA